MPKFESSRLNSVAIIVKPHEHTHTERERVREREAETDRERHTRSYLENILSVIYKLPCSLSHCCIYTCVIKLQYKDNSTPL